MMSCKYLNEVQKFGEQKTQTIVTAHMMTYGKRNIQLRIQQIISMEAEVT